MFCSISTLTPARLTQGALSFFSALSPLNLYLASGRSYYFKEKGTFLKQNLGIFVTFAGTVKKFLKFYSCQQARIWGRKKIYAKL